MSEKAKEVETMINKVMSKKDLTRAAAIDYMLVVATGRLAALWRYDKTLPEGKATKGILTVVGRKKRAEKTPSIASKLAAAAEKSERAPKVKKPRKRKPKPDATAEAQAAE